jgi:hypothetical protein
MLNQSKKIIMSLLISSNILYATNNSVELNINNHTLEVKGEYNLNAVYELNDNSNYKLLISYLRSEKKQDSEIMINSGLKIENPYINDYGFSVGFGVNAVWIDNSNQSFTALPLSVYGSYILQENITINGQVSYSPNILSFNNARSFRQYNLQANYKLIDNGYVYIGKRDIKTNYKNSVSIKFDDAIFFGFKVLF